jgi:hypothetical protein
MKKTQMWALLAVVLAGCEGAAATAGSGPLAGPLYAVSHSVYTDDGATSYVTLTPSLRAGPAVDLAHSLEFGGGARAYGTERKDVVYVTSSERATMTEVTFDPDGSPHVGRVVSFENLGISSTTGGNVHLFVSPTKVYFASQALGAIVVWNPKAMELVTSIPLGLDAQSAGGSFYFYPQPILVGDRLVLIANRADAEDFDAGAVVAVVDTRMDRVQSTTVEPRCHGMLQSAVDAAGDRYFASSDYAAAQHLLLPDRAPGPCMLRMRGGQSAFDIGWSRSLTADVGSRLWTGVTPGPAGVLYEQSIAEDAPGVVSAAAALEPFDVTIAEPWIWHLLAGGEAAPMRIDVDFLRTPPGFPAIAADGAAYVALGGEVETTLVDMTSSTTPVKGLVVPGYVFNIVRIR